MTKSDCFLWKNSRGKSAFINILCLDLDKDSPEITPIFRQAIDTLRDRPALLRYSKKTLQIFTKKKSNIINIIDK